MKRGDRNPPEGTPVVGNVLGFSLLFRDRKALLALGRRGIAPGVRLRDYEAEIPGVSFPLKAPLSAAEFRDRRCKAVRVTLSLEDRALRPWLEARLSGIYLGGVRWDAVDVELRRQLPDSSHNRPFVHVEGRTRDGGIVWLSTAFDLAPHGRSVRLTPRRHWLVGTPEKAAEDLWKLLARRLRPEVRVEDDGSLIVDPSRLALFHAFVSVGWKAPDLARLGIESVTLGRRAITVELRRDADSEAVDEPEVAAATVGDSVGEALDRAREQLAEREQSPKLARARALSILEQISATIQDFPAAQLSVVRWRVQLSRWTDHSACLDALHEWLDLQPSALWARRMLAVQLARAGESERLARLLAAEARLPRSPAPQARLELAIASLLIERLDDPRSALAMVGPVINRLRTSIESAHESGSQASRAETRELAGLLPDALTLLASARASEAAATGYSIGRAPHAMEALDEALAATDNPERRADLRARVARTLTRCGAHTLALELLTRAITEDPESDSLVDDAIELSLRVGERESAVSLLQLRLDRVSEEHRDERHDLRRRLVAVLSELDDPAHRAAALDHLRVAIEYEPESAGLLRMAATLERRQGDPLAAAEHLERLLDLPRPQGDDRGRETEGMTALVLERAELLKQGHRPDEAWECLHRALESDLRGDELSVAVLDLALDLAPPSERPRIVDRLIDATRGVRRADALLERAAQAINVEDRLRDLWMAVDEVDDPDEILAKIEILIDERDVSGLRAIADACAKHRAPTTELSARIRLADALLAAGEREAALPELQCGLEIEAGRIDLAYLVGTTLEDLGRIHEAGDVLDEVFSSGSPFLRRADGTPRNQADLADRTTLALHCVELFEAANDDRRAADILSRALALQAVDSEQAHEMAERLFDLHVAANRRTSALELALARSAIENGSGLAQWLARAAELRNAAPAEGHPNRRTLLERAHSLAPEDAAITRALEAELRICGAADALETLIREQLEARPDDERRRELLIALIDVIESGAARGARGDELAEWYADLLNVDPNHAASLLALGALRFGGGDEQGAADPWRRAIEILDDDDPRLFQPSLVLGRQCLLDGDTGPARDHCWRSLGLRPTDHAALELAHEVAAATDEPALRIRACQGLLADLRAPWEAAPLAFEQGAAHTELDEIESAFACFAKACDHADPGSALHLESAENWLALATSEPNLSGGAGAYLRQELDAREQMRAALGRDLEIADLLRLTHLLIAPEIMRSEAEGQRDRERAIELLEGAMLQRGSPPLLVQRLAELLRESGDDRRLLVSLKRALDGAGEADARLRLALLLFDEARRLDDANTAMTALDRVPPEYADTPALLERRAWTARSLDRVEDELARVDQKLAAGDLEEALIEHYAGLLDDDEVGVAQRLLEVGSKSPAPIAIELAVCALERLASRTPLPDEIGEALRIDALTQLVARRHLDPVRDHWQDLEADLDELARESNDYSMLARLALSIAASDDRELCGSALAMIGSRLPGAPLDPQLYGALSTLLEGNDVALLGSEAATAHWQALFAHVELIADSRHLDNGLRVRMIEGLARSLDAEPAAKLLLHAATVHIGSDDIREPIADLLEQRNRWPELLAVLESRGCEEVDPWREIAERARSDADTVTESAARARAGELLLARAEDLNESGEPSMEAPEAAASEFERVLDIDPDRREIRHALGRAKEIAGELRGALTHYLPLVRGQGLTALGIDHTKLAHRCGQLLAQEDDLEEAVDLLGVAMSRASGHQRDEIAEDLYRVQVELELDREAVELAASAANESEIPERKLEWLRRAAALIGGDQRVALLRRAREIDPDDPDLLDELEEELRSTDAQEGVEQILRERLNRASDGSQRARALEALLDHLDPGPEPSVGGEHGSMDERATLWEALLALEPNHVDALLGFAAYCDHHGDHRRSREFWNRAAPLIPSSDPRFLGPSKRLAELALGQRPPDRAGARLHLLRALEVAPGDPTLLGRLRDVALALEDPQLMLHAVKPLLALGASTHDTVRLERDAAFALASLGERDEAVASFRRAADLAEEGADIERLLVERWLELTRPDEEDWAADDIHSRELEAEACARHRMLPGQRLTLDEQIREISLLESINKLEAALELLETALAEQPREAKLMELLERMSRASERPDRLLVSLKGILDAQSLPELRDEIAERLAMEARRADVARTTLYALERLSGRMAGTAKMLDLREWAIRKLGRVDDELIAIDRELRRTEGDPVLITRLMRMLEQDAEASAARLLEIAAVSSPDDSPRPETITWLTRNALDLLRKHRPEQLGMAIEAVRTLVTAGSGPTRHWDDLVTLAMLRADDDDSHLLALVDIADRAEQAGRAGFSATASSLLSQALIRYPRRAALYAVLVRLLARNRGGTDSLGPAVADWLTALADENRLDDRHRAHLHLGAADAMGTTDAIPMLLGLARDHIERPILFTALREGLERRRAWPEVISLREATGADAREWSRIADEAAADQDDPSEAVARSRAGSMFHRDRDLEPARTALARAHELLPNDVHVRHRLGTVLDELDDPEALSHLLPLLELDADTDLELEPGRLALTCARLAQTRGDRELAARVRALALATLSGPDHERAAADQFELLEELGQNDEARSLAQRCASRRDHDELAWVTRAARLTPEADRAGLLRRALDLADDEAVADELESILRVTEERDGLERHLRSRLRAATTRGDGERSVALIERLLPLVDEVNARSELLESLVRLAPEHAAAFLELGQIRLAGGDPAAAAEFWQRAGELIDEADERFFSPARELASLALAAGDPEHAKSHLERALAIVPDDREVLEQLLAVGRVLADEALVLTSATKLLESANFGEESALDLVIESAMAERALGRFREACVTFERACRLAEPGSDRHREIAARWLRTTVADDFRTSMDERERATLEIEARAEARAALGSGLPVRALCTEAELRAHALGDLSAAVELLVEGLLADPTSRELLASLETCCLEADNPGAYLDALDRVLDECRAESFDDGAMFSLAERQARAARGAADAEACMHALDRLPPERFAMAELFGLREWAIRELGCVDEELGRLEAGLSRTVDASRRRELFEELVHYIDGDVGRGVGRLLALADGEVDEAVSAGLARLALDLARERVPDDLDTSIAALAGVARHVGSAGLAGAWPEIERVALELNEFDPLEKLLTLAIAAETTGALAFGDRVDRMLRAAVRLQPGEARLHNLIDARVELRGVEQVATLVQTAHLEGEALVAYYIERACRMQEQELPAYILDRALERLEDVDARWGFAQELERRRAWRQLLELHEAGSDFDTKPDLGGLLIIADAAAADSDMGTELRARLRAGRHLLDTGVPTRACVQLARALDSSDASDAEGAGDLDARDLLCFQLAQAYEDSGRLSHAVEHYLPLLDIPDERSSRSVPQPIAKLARHCGELLIDLSDLPRAALILDRTRQIYLKYEAEHGEPTPERLEVEESLHQLYTQLERHAEALRLALSCAEDRDDGERIPWLERAAALAEGAQRVELLTRLLDAGADDPAVAVQLEAELRIAGDQPRLASLLRERLSSALREVPPDSSNVLELSRRLLPLIREDPTAPSTDPTTATERLTLLGHIVENEPLDAEAQLELAGLLARDELAEAAPHWRAAGDVLARDDERFWEPALRLAELAATRGEIEDARALLERARACRPDSLEPLLELRGLASNLDDAELSLDVAIALLTHTDSGVPRVELEVDCAEALLDLDRLIDAMAAFERACRAAEPGSTRHREIARRWVQSSGGQGLHAQEFEPEEERSSASLEREAAARAELRAALGSELPRSELRSEATLLVTRLGRADDGLTLIDEALSVDPGDELLFSCFKDLCQHADEQTRYVQALERAVDDLDQGEARDRLATELAFASIELDDAERLMRVFERLSPERAVSPELLDLREWAIRKLGKIDDELGEINAQLVSAVDTRMVAEVLVPRLFRMLDQDADRVVQHLLGLSKEAESPESRRLGALALDLVVTHQSTLDAQVAPRRALESTAATLSSHEGDPPSEPDTSIRTHWQHLTALSGHSPEDAGELLDLAEQAESLGLEMGERTRDFLHSSLRTYPDGLDLHRVLWRRFALDDASDRPEVADAALGELTDELELEGGARAYLWVGFSRLLERRDAADLLLRRATDELNAEIIDPDALRELVRALEDSNHWTHAREVLEQQVARTEADETRVTALKHLAHLCADILGETDAAIGHLEDALELAPEDPDLLLPLLDHYYAQPRLDRAIELSVRVMKHVPMGDIAYGALGNRAADAALARGDHAQAEALLANVMQRSPADTRTAARISELRGLADDPDHRVRMLAAVAARQTGSARAEALEERVRLLVDSLRRHDEAINDLEAVLEEFPSRRASAEKLAELYEHRERWPELAALLEREFASATGFQRSDMLRRLAGIYHDHLYDPAKAERALRLASDNLEAPEAGTGEAELHDLIQSDLAESMLEQGRYSDLAAHLERELAADLEEGSRPSTARLALLGTLATVYREYLEEPTKAARVYARLEALNHLPESGLATLARFYRSQHRHEDLVRLLVARAREFGEAGETERKAEADFRIGELLEGPLRRPHEAARYFLDAYLADPDENPEAGRRARVLLAGTDSIVNVRRRLTARLDNLPEAHQAALNTLLGDILAPQDQHEDEAERRYRMALESNPELAPALEGLGRLLARQGRLDEAVEPLVAAAKSLYLEPGRAATDAATAARALLELGRVDEAESVLKHALGRAPQAERAMLELARLYHGTGRPGDEAEVLDDLGDLKLSSMMRAEVAYRRALLLQPQFDADPHGEAGESARAYLLEAVGADAMHAQARQILLDLATVRGEWSIVAHMHFLAIRELAPGIPRALRHLDLAETYLDHLDDEESAARNLASALQVEDESGDLIVFERARTIADRLRAPGAAAERLWAVAGNEGGDFGPTARARACLIGAELNLRNDDFESAQRCAEKILEIDGTAGPLPRDLAEAGRRHLEMVTHDDADLLRQRKVLQKLLAEEESANEKLHILGRLRELGRKLDDRELVESSSKSLLQLAHGLARDGEDREAAISALRELHAERGDFMAIVELYEEIASMTADSEAAANMLIDGARVAWSGLRDPQLAVAILRRALGRHANLPLATTIFAEIAGATEDPGVDATICDELSQLEPSSRPPLLALRLAEAALRLDRREQAHEVLRQLLAGPAPAELRLAALTQLDGLLAHAGRTAERLAVLEERLLLTRSYLPDRAGEAAMELARTQRNLGKVMEARRSCATALEAHPSHFELARLHAELLEQAEEWAELALALEHLARLSLADEDQAMWLTRAAWVHLERTAAGVEAINRARRLLAKARESSSASVEARAALLPLEFEARQWDSVLEIAVEIRAVSGNDEEVLMFAAVVEAFVSGKRTIARTIGARHHRETRTRTLWPALAEILDILASDGPLPQLDAVLSACAAMSGGTEDLYKELSAWAAAQRVRPGICLAMARLEEAFGQMDVARDLYQLAAFLTPEGPVSMIATRIAASELPEDPLHQDEWVPVEWRGALREMLIQLRDDLAGIRIQQGDYTVPDNAIERATIQTAGRLAGRWREALGVPIPIRLTTNPLPAGVGVRNDLEPLIVVNEEFITAPDAERSFRLAMAASAIATGIACIADTHPVEPLDLVDALLSFSRPRHEAVREAGGIIADVLADRGLTAARIPPDLRTTLERELTHWETAPGALARTLRRACVFMATRLSGSLEGALMAMGRDSGQAHGTATQNLEIVESPDAQWLIRTLGLLGER